MIYNITVYCQRTGPTSNMKSIVPPLLQKKPSYFFFTINSKKDSNFRALGEIYANSDIMLYDVIKDFLNNLKSVHTITCCAFPL